jgi:hypothetical protein
LQLHTLPSQAGLSCCRPPTCPLQGVTGTDTITLEFEMEDIRNPDTWDAIEEFAEDAVHAGNGGVGRSREVHVSLQPARC